MKICLCGSTRFMDQFNAVNALLTLQGHIVYSVAMVSSQASSQEVSNEQKTILDLVYLRKILESDSVVVVGRQKDDSMYIGESTRREILWASLWNKSVYFWNQETSQIFLEKNSIDESQKSINYAKMSQTQRDEKREADIKAEFGEEQ